MKTLIVNIGASGDVVRTTVLLKVLKGEIYWLTKSSMKELLTTKKIKKVFALDKAEEVKEIENIEFDLIVSLNEERKVLDVVKNLKTQKLIGVYLDGENVKYTPESNYWFDMSLVSRLGKKKADELKLNNKKSYPQMLVEMAGGKWEDQTYDMGIESKPSRGRIGLIDVETGLWPNKLWYGFSELKEILKSEGYQVVSLGMRPTITEHINDINSCELIICGDTFGLHAAIALKKKVIGLFTCTSPDEIYPYGLLTKIISPLYKQYFYRKEFIKEATTAIPIEEVYDAVKKVLKA